MYKANSIYEVFCEYDMELINVILYTMKFREKVSYAKLVNIYGNDFKSRVNRSLTYSEIMALDSIQKRMNEKLEYATSLIESGKSLDNITKLFKNTNDVKLVEMMTQNKKDENDAIILKSKKDILRRYHMTEKELTGAIDFIPEKKERLAFKYKYGIGTNEREEKEILKLLSISNTYYSSILLNTFTNLDSYLKKYKDYISEFKETKSVDKKKSPIKIEKTSRQEEKSDIPIMNFDTEKNNKEIESKSISKGDNNSTFFDKVIPDTIAGEERIKLENNILSYINCRENISVNSSIKLYGEDLKHYNPKAILTRREKTSIKNLMYTIKKKINSGYRFDDITSVNYKKVYNPTSFFAGLINNDLSIEEQTILKNKIINYLLYGTSIAAKNAFILYGENLEQYNPNSGLTKDEKSGVSWLKSDIKRKIQTNTFKDLAEVELMPFFDRIIPKNVEVSKRMEIEQKILEYVKASSSEGAKVSLIVYGEDLKSYNPNHGLSAKQRSCISPFAKSLKNKVINNQNIVIPVYHDKTFSDENYSFFGDLIDDSMPESQKQLIKEEVINYVKKSNSDAAKDIIEIFGEDLEYFNREREFTREQKMRIASLKRTLKNKIKDGTLFEKDYFYTKFGMEENNSILMDLVDKHKNVDGYRIAVSLYGNKLDQLSNDTYLTKVEQSSLYYFIKIIKQELMKKTDNNVIDINENNIIEVENVVEDEPIVLEENDSIDLMEDTIINNDVVSIEDKLDYIEVVIKNLFDNGYNPKMIAKTIDIDEEYIVNTLIDLYPYLVNKYELINFISLSGDRVKRFIETEYMQEGLKNCSKKEIQLLYFKLLAISNPLITDEFIASTIGIDKNLIEEYSLMTKDDFVNELGNYILNKKLTGNEVNPILVTLKKD